MLQGGGEWRKRASVDETEGGRAKGCAVCVRSQWCRAVSECESATHVICSIPSPLPFPSPLSSFPAVPGVRCAAAARLLSGRFAAADWLIETPLTAGLERQTERKHKPKQTKANANDTKPVNSSDTFGWTQGNTQKWTGCDCDNGLPCSPTQIMTAAMAATHSTRGGSANLPRSLRRPTVSVDWFHHRAADWMRQVHDSVHGEHVCGWRCGHAGNGSELSAGRAFDLTQMESQRAQRLCRWCAAVNLLFPETHCSTALDVLIAPASIVGAQTGTSIRTTIGRP